MVGWIEKDPSEVNNDNWSEIILKNKPVISFDTDGGSAIAPIQQAWKSVVTPPATPTKAGYTFAGWTPSLPATMPFTGMTLTAQWTKKVSSG